MNRTVLIGPLLILLQPGIAQLFLSAQTTLVAQGSTWRYLDDGSDQGTAWRASAFDDSSWSSGPAELGYGDGDEATVVSFGPDPDAKYPTTYFRHSFTVNEPSLYERVDLNLRRDDGAIVYLNGTEVVRSNMPSGTIDYLTFASATVSGSDEDTLQGGPIDTSLLVAGTNVLAVEIHQRRATSSDISFELELIGYEEGFVEVTRGPYLQRGSPTEVTVRWRTDLPSSSSVGLGETPGAPDRVIDDAFETTEHVVLITDLDPATRYYYSVGTLDGVLVGGDTEHTFVTAPTPGSDSPMRIWVLGDSGTANSDAEAVRDAFLNFSGGVPPSFWLMLGDNAYPDGTDEEYQDAVFEMYPTTLRKSVLWSTLGNHDGHSASSTTETGPYYDIFTFPKLGEAGGIPSSTEAYYSFDYGNVHVVCLDSYDSDNSPGSAMLTWLADDLTATDAEWLIAFWHHPPYSKGSHDSDSEGRLVDMREHVLPILEGHGVDLVLSGHSHAYERSRLLDQHYGDSSTLQPWMVLDDGDGSVASDGAYRKPGRELIPNEGAIYAVAGSSGKTSGGSLDHPIMEIAVSELGSLVLDIEGHRLDATFVHHTGTILDDFTIVKDPDSSGLIFEDGLETGNLSEWIEP